MMRLGNFNNFCGVFVTLLFQAFTKRYMNRKMSSLKSFRFTARRIARRDIKTTQTIGPLGFAGSIPLYLNIH
jgi:hypothetical protein